MGMILDGVAGSEQPDKSAEILDISGADISDWTSGLGVINWEHEGKEASDIIGRIIYAKKIFKRSDCENKRQLEYWDFVNCPLIYIKGELFDSDGHAQAKACAAIIRHYQKKELPILVRWSVEGSTLEQNGPLLKRTVCRRIALTIKPANSSAISGVISDENKNSKDEESAKADPLAFLIGAKKNENPDYRRLGYSPIVKCDPEFSLIGILSECLGELKKTISAGQYNAAPGTLIGGAALQREDQSLHNITFRNKAKSALRDYDPDKHGKFREYIKHQMPEASDDFIDRFVNAVGDWKVTRNQILSKAEFKIHAGKRGSAYFDHSEGILHTPEGRFKIFIPDLKDKNYGEILRDPKINRIHDKAIKNWITVHKAVKSGQIPVELVALASMFSSMSSNSFNPLHESVSETPEENLSIKKSENQDSRYSKELESISSGQKLPVWERDHFASRGYGSGNLSNSNPKKWNDIKNSLTNLVSKYGIDGRNIALAINNAKSKSSSKSKNVGFAPETIRYALGIMGLGDVTVPDSNFIRHIFSLHISGTDPKNEIIKKYLWNEHSEPLIAELDKYYYNNHPAVAYTRSKLRQQLNEDLKEQALLPSFWLDWLTIQSHEKKYGMINRAHHAITGHSVFWNTVKNVLNKYGIPHDYQIIKHDYEDGGSMATRVAHAVKELENQFGFLPATLALYATMIPAVLSHKESFQSIKKTELLTEKLKGLIKAEVNNIVDSKKHGIPGLSESPEQQKLLHGLDLDLPIADPQTTNIGTSAFHVPQHTGWRKNESGDLGYTKPAIIIDSRSDEIDSDKRSFSTSHRESAFYHLANNFFGLGEHVPVTSAFYHPTLGKPHSVQKIVEGGEHLKLNDPNHESTMSLLLHTGQLDKLSLMDLILGSHDRHPGNFLLTPKKSPYMHLIDNGLSIGEDRYLSIPDYAKDLKGTLHSEANNWLQNLDPNKLSGMMDSIGVPKENSTEAVRRLKVIQEQAQQPGIDKITVFNSPMTSFTDSPVKSPSRKIIPPISR